MNIQQAQDYIGSRIETPDYSIDRELLKKICISLEIYISGLQNRDLSVDLIFKIHQRTFEFDTFPEMFHSLILDLYILFLRDVSSGMKDVLYKTSEEGIKKLKYFFIEE